MNKIKINYNDLEYMRDRVDYLCRGMNATVKIYSNRETGSIGADVEIISVPMVNPYKARKVAKDLLVAADICDYLGETYMLADGSSYYDKRSIDGAKLYADLDRIISNSSVLYQF